MADFFYQEMLPLGEDTTEYRKLTDQHVQIRTLTDESGQATEVLEVDSEALVTAARAAFDDMNHFYRTRHLKSLARILDDEESSQNDLFVARELLENAVIAAEGQFPSCQDTGTALVLGKKGQRVWTDENDSEAISRGVFRSYTEGNYRYSQLTPLSMFEEKNTGSNLPAQIEINAVPGDEYRLLFIAKGGGSANKFFLFQQTKALLNPASFEKFVDEKLRGIGTAACPPYHLALVVGGTSADYTMKVTKLATAGYLDDLPTSGSLAPHAFRDLEMEKKVLQISRDIGIGAQFGGKYFCHDVRVIRLPRHGASCPVGMGVSCSADRNIKAKITREGVFIEQLDTDPARFLKGAKAVQEGKAAVAIDLNRPIEEICAELGKHPIATRLTLTGEIIVARDIAHARLKEQLDKGEALPEYFKNHIIYYAGPAKTPDGEASGSFGPTTAQRMDSYVPIFQALGASRVTLAKGNRSPIVTQSCKEHGGFYLGSVGGPAARLGRDCITKVEVIDFPELGMEAVHKISVENFPAFIVVNDKGEDFFDRFRPDRLVQLT
jgi:fumarate hydratase class I